MNLEGNSFSELSTYFVGMILVNLLGPSSIELSNR
jgi:hypothetical protein